MVSAKRGPGAPCAHRKWGDQVNRKWDWREVLLPC
jgi:hypothetical protein